MRDEIKKSSSFLQTGKTGLGNLLLRVKEWEIINQRLAAIIEPALWKYCRSGGINAGQLVIIAANGSIASQIRFQSADILLKCKSDSELKHITSIHCKVLPSFAYSAHTNSRLSAQDKNAQPLSATSAAIIKDIAETIDDPNLREIMQRLATRTKNHAEISNTDE